MKQHAVIFTSKGYLAAKRGGVTTILLVCNLLASLILGLGLVWFGNDYTDTGYTLRTQQRTLESMLAHNDKLEIEREFLLSPAELERRAAELGLVEAKPGQVRRIQETGP
jgi:hypothetical protein